MPAGRPKIDLDVVELEKLAALQCTYEEAAAWFGVCKRTFVKKLQQKHYREQWENGQRKGLISLRRTQFRLAEKSAGMAIFLGKNLLGQRDLQVHGLAGGDGQPIKLESWFDLAREALSGGTAQPAVPEAILAVTTNGHGTGAGNGDGEEPGAAE